MGSLHLPDCLKQCIVSNFSVIFLSIWKYFTLFPISYYEASSSLQDENENLICAHIKIIWSFLQHLTSNTGCWCGRVVQESQWFFTEFSLVWHTYPWLDRVTSNLSRESSLSLLQGPGGEWFGSKGGSLVSGSEVHF